MDSKKICSLLLLRIILVVVGIVAAVCVAEIAVRKSGYRRPPYSSILLPAEDNTQKYGLKPNSEGWFEKTAVKINSKGLRDKEYSFKKARNIFRIFVLGRCIVFGHGVQLRKTFPKQLEAVLNEKMTSEKITHYEVINGGTPGGYRKTGRLVKFFKEEGVKYDPDLLIFHWAMRPSKWQEILKRQPSWVRFFILKIIPRMPRQLTLTWFLYEKLRFYQWSVIWNKIMEEKGGMVNYMNEKYSEPEDIWQEEKRALEELFAFAKHRKIPVLVVIFPWMNYFDVNHPFQSIYNRVTDTCNKNNVSSLNLLDKFMNVDPKSLWLHSNDRRPNEYGHWIITIAIYQRLLKEGFVKEANSQE